MLKKAGIVVAAVAAGLLAVSPLAFAGEADPATSSHDGMHSASVHSDDKHEDAKHDDAKHDDGKHSDGKHSDGKHSDGKHSDGKHSDGKHSDGKHSDAKPPTYDHSPDCSFNTTNDNSVKQQGVGSSAVLGALSTVLNTAAPVNGQVQAPILSCNNLQDIGNVTLKDTTVDKSTNDTVTKSTTDNSFNSVLPLGG